MGIKLKKDKRNYAFYIVILLISILTVSLYPIITRHSETNNTSFFDTNNFSRIIAAGNLELYYKLNNVDDDRIKSPFEVLAITETKSKNQIEEDQDDFFEDDSYDIENFNSRIKGLDINEEGVKYYAYDVNTEEFVTNLSAYKIKTHTLQNQHEYQYILEITFDSNGRASIDKISTGNEKAIYASVGKYSNGEQYGLENAEIKIKDVKIIYAVEKDVTESSYVGHNVKRTHFNNYYTGLMMYFNIFVAVLVVLSLFLKRDKIAIYQKIKPIPADFFILILFIFFDKRLVEFMTLGLLGYANGDIGFIANTFNVILPFQFSYA